jgi:plasmid stability protein
MTGTCPIRCIVRSGDILDQAVKPAKRIRLGEALAALGRKLGLTDEDVAIIDQTRDKSPAEPTILNERAP